MEGAVEQAASLPAPTQTRRRHVPVPPSTSSSPTLAESSPPLPSAVSRAPSSTPSDESCPAAPPSPSYSTASSSSPSLGSALRSCSAQLAYELLPYEALPAWFRDNPYIGSGYRVEIGWRNAVASLCHLHNETVNIWTHAVAFALVLVLLVVTLVAMSPHGVDRIDLDVVHMADVVSQQQSAAAELRLADFRSAVCTASSPSYNCSADGADSADERRSAAAASAHSSFVSGLEALFSSSSAFLPSAVSEGYGRLQRHLPIVQRLTQALRAQADSMASLLSSSSPALLSPFPPLSSLSSTPARFVAFLTRVESHLSSLHSAVSSRVTVDNALRLKALLVDNVGGFTQQLTLPQVDVLRLVRALIDDFLRSTREGETGTGEQRAELHDGRDDASQHSHEMGRSDDTASPTAARADGDDDVGGAVGLAVRVKRWAGLSGADLLFALSDERALLAPADVLELTRRRQWEEDVQLHLYLPRWPLTAFMVSALACLLFSALFHCFQAVSRPVSVLFQNMDYAGITLLIAGSNIPVIYYGFYCAPLTAAVYNGVISALAGVCFLITVLPAFRDLRFRTLKTLLFLALGFSGVGPLIHLIVHLEHVHFIVFYLLAMGCFYVCGAVVYLFHIPERWWPGRFDILCSSHQIWHLAIVAAVLTHYVGVIHLFEWRFHHVCPAAV